jgi:hypothetical protein
VLHVNDLPTKKLADEGFGVNFNESKKRMIFTYSGSKKLLQRAKETSAEGVEVYYLPSGSNCCDL